MVPVSVKNSERIRNGRNVAWLTRSNKEGQ